MGDDREALFLDAVLRPNPPLGSRSLGVILLIFLAINIAFGLAFWVRGAWPIAPFMGADVALLAWTFRESWIAASAHEDIRLSSSQLRVEHHPPRGSSRTTVLNPYWVAVKLEAPEDMPRRLWLRSHGKSIQVGSFLDPRERLAFAETLKHALSAAKGGHT